MDNLVISESVRLIGKLRLGDNVYLAQGSVLRSVDDSITIRNSSWILENSVLIGMKAHPLQVGSKTVFGHKSIVIGATIGNLCEIGNGAIILAGAKIGDMCILGEGTIIPENSEISAESVVVGRPGRVIRKLTSADKAMIKKMRGNDLSLNDYQENIIISKVKEGETMGKINKLGDKAPVVASSAIIYDSAEINGDVIIGEKSIIAAGVKIIGDSHGPVRIGNNVQILENSVLHLLPDNELIIEDNVIIGPGCIIHGSKIGANSVIESGAIICDYSKIGQNTLIKSGTLVKQRSVFSDNQVLVGFPAQVAGENKALIKKPDWGI